MKKVFLLIGMLGLLASCSLDDEGQEFRYEIEPVTNVEFPDSLVLGQNYQIPVRYLRPSTCHSFFDFDYARQDSTRIVTVINQVFENDSCEDLTDTEVEQILDFEVLYNYTYVFKFYQGQDTNDEPIYLTKNVPVKAN